MRNTSTYAHDVCVVGGAGHVGLPLALTFAGKGLRVAVFDVDVETLAVIRSGRMPFVERGAEALLRQALDEGRLSVSSDPSAVAGAGVVVVTIGTPPGDALCSVFRKLADAMLPHLSDDQLVVLRSTVPPGTTDWLHRYLQANGRNPDVAFCPERIAQGKSIEEIRVLGQIVSGTTPEAERRAAALFGCISRRIVHMTPVEAELAKLFGNAYRYIQFAIANQFHMIANAAGVDYSRVLEGMKKDYPRALGLPSAGFAAGPCLQQDTMQLAAFAGDAFTLGQPAIDANQGLVDHLVEDIRDTYGDLGRLRIGLLGMAFKADSDDTRFSLSYKLKDQLAGRAREVLTTDPHVTADPSLAPVAEVVAASDLLVLCVPHDAYRGLDRRNKPVVDVWGFLDRE